MGAASTGSWMGSAGFTDGKQDSAAPRGAYELSSLWFPSLGSPQLSAQHLAYVGQRSQPHSGTATPCLA